MEHIPVLIEEIVEYVKTVKDLKLIIDGTLGLGGYAERFLEEFPQVKVIGTDLDKSAIEIADNRLKKFGDRFSSRQINFKDVHLIENIRNSGPDIVVLDLGVSNLQLTEPERGFSYQEDGPLDMRMNPDETGKNTISAGEVINTFSAEDMSDIFRIYGEERNAWKIAKGIVRYREKEGPLLTTSDLVNAIRTILPAPVQRKMGKHPGRKIFQALRIYVNNELENLKGGLDIAASVTREEGLVIIVSYHSLEDRIVKHTFREWKQEHRGQILTKKPIVPTDEEVERNRKARSAKLRVFKMKKKIRNEGAKYEE